MQVFKEISAKEHLILYKTLEEVCCLSQINVFTFVEGNDLLNKRVVKHNESTLAAVCPRLNLPVLDPLRGVEAEHVFGVLLRVVQNGQDLFAVEIVDV